MTKNNINLIMAIVFLIAFLFFWDAFVMSRYGTSRPPQQKVPITKGASPQDKETVIEDYRKKSSLNISHQMTTSEEEKISVRISGNDVTFGNKGAKVLSWKIKENSHWLELVVPEQKRKVSPLETFPELIFTPKKISEDKLEFLAARSDGVVIEKTIHFQSHPPFHSLLLRFKNKSDGERTIETFLGWGNGIDKQIVGEPYNDKTSQAALAESRAVAFDGQPKDWKAGFIFNRSVHTRQTGSFTWVGVDNHHFLAALIAPGGKIPAVEIHADRETPPIAGVPLQIELPPGAAIEKSFLLFVGAKKYDDLKLLDYDIHQAVDFGFFGYISKALLFLLNLFESMTGNYGWAIIILTFIIQIIVFPLTIKNFKHSIRMKELQPQLKKIQTQFKSDPKRLQAETFNLYRKNGMKFMGMEGCFPMLLQIPIFFAFYSTLNVAYELRGAPWILWIQDLGAHDPYYVLPILMGLGMFLQQKLTSVSIDPAQARMMNLMPLMFTFMFLKLPAGLVLYWCVNSLTNIVIQRLMMAKAHSSPPPA